jgi:FlaG protein
MTLLEMTSQIGRFVSTAYAQPTAFPAVGTHPPKTPPARAVQGPNAGDENNGVVVGAVPLAPAPEAREMVQKAAQRVEELRAENRELHFTRDQDSNRVVIEVRDLDGNVIRTIPPEKALDIMSGAAI